MKKFSQVSGAVLVKLERREKIREEESLLSNFLKTLFDQLLVPGTIVFSGQNINLG